MLGVTAFAAYSWTQTRYFIGADEDSVVIFQGVQQNIGPITLSTPIQDTDILLANLPPYQRASVRAHHHRALTLRRDGDRGPAQSGCRREHDRDPAWPTPMPTPVDTPEGGEG